MIYLDNQLVRPTFPEVLTAREKIIRQRVIAPFAPHKMGGELFISDIQAAERAILKALCASENDKLFFTHSGAAAHAHLYLIHYMEFIRQTARTHLITTEIEDAQIKLGLKRLERDLACSVTFLKSDRSLKIDLNAFADSIKPRTSLVSISYASTLTGVIQPIAEIAKICKEKQVRLHVDVSCAIGKATIDFTKLGIDYLTFDGAQIGAGCGGALLVRADHTFSPLVIGDGTIDVAALVGCAKALEITVAEREEMGMEVARKRGLFEDAILQRIPGATSPFMDSGRLPNCALIAFPGAVADALLFLLARNGLCASMGGGKCQKIAHMLQAVGFSSEVANGALSFQLSTATTEEELEKAADLIVDAWRDLARLSDGIMGEA